MTPEQLAPVLEAAGASLDTISCALGLTGDEVAEILMLHDKRERLIADFHAFVDGVSPVDFA